MGCGSSKTNVVPLNNLPDAAGDNHTEETGENNNVNVLNQDQSKKPRIDSPGAKQATEIHPFTAEDSSKMEDAAAEDQREEITAIDDCDDSAEKDEADSPDANDAPKVKLTEEEKHQKLMERIHTKVPWLHTLETADDFTSKESISEINYIKNRIGVNKDRNKRRIYYAELQKLNFVDLILKIWKTLFGTNFTEKGMKTHRDVMRTSQLVIWNGTDISKEICQEVVAKGGHSFFLECLNDEKLASSDFSNPSVVIITKGIFGVFHNLLQNTDEARTALRGQNGVEIISSYKEKGNTMFQCKALICLSYLVNVEENEKLISNDKTFKFMVHILEDALEKRDHRSKKYGYSLEEIAQAINLLAANDQNKEKLTEKGLVDKYGQILTGEFRTMEKFQAANGLWILAFSKKCREVISATESCMKGLREVQHEDDMNLKKAIRGALWLIDGKDKEERHKKIDSKKGHIMISYNWSNQAILLKVRDILQNAGYNVWMDVDQMSGNILQAMAEAIEKASIVLICFSHKYYESPNCRLEAEYAYQKKKPIIPLKMEYGYNPEGWLGILIGSSLYFDFARENKYNTSISGLLKEIERKDNGGQAVTEIKAATVNSAPGGPSQSPQPHGAIVPPRISKCMQWNLQQVQDWLAEIGLSKHQERFSDFDGSLLLELQYMLREAPESYYKTVREEMTFPLVDMLKLTKEIKKL